MKHRIKKFKSNIETKYRIQRSLLGIFWYDYPCSKHVLKQRSPVDEKSNYKVGYDAPTLYHDFDLYSYDDASKILQFLNSPKIHRKYRYNGNPVRKIFLKTETNILIPMYRTWMTDGSSFDHYIVGNKQFIHKLIDDHKYETSILNE